MTFLSSKMIHVIQGEHAVSDDPESVLTTVLGSCVSACISDRTRGIGGMNHFLLPTAPSCARDIRYAAAATETLVNALLRTGATRSGMQAKLFGGAHMMPGLPDIGTRNAEAARTFLEAEGITISPGDVGGVQARRIRFWPASGRIQMQLLPRSSPAPVETVMAPRRGDDSLF